MYFKKGNAGGLYKKGEQLIHYAQKGIQTAAGIADSPVFGMAVGAVAPELLPAYAGIKASGYLQKIKR